MNTRLGLGGLSFEFKGGVCSSGGAREKAGNRASYLMACEMTLFSMNSLEAGGRGPGIVTDKKGRICYLEALITLMNSDCVIGLNR